MANKELKLIIGKDGSTKIEANGFSGGTCATTISQLIQAVGGNEVSEEKKPEFYDPDGDNLNELFNAGM